MSTPPLPTDIDLDTSVVVAAMFPGAPNSSACAGFCAALARNRSHVYFSQILRLELAQTLRQLATKLTGCRATPAPGISSISGPQTS